MNKLELFVSKCVCVLLLCFIVKIREIKEIRPGKNSRDFERWPDEAKRYDSSLCLVICYGAEFRLKSLSVVGKDDKNVTFNILVYTDSVKTKLFGIPNWTC